MTKKKKFFAPVALMFFMADLTELQVCYIIEEIGFS